MPYGIALDYVRLALAHVLTASCERANKLVHSGFSGLPTGLREDDAASEDGLAITVYGANAAAAEARLLAHPTTLELSTSSTAEGIEDRVIPTTLAARRLEEMSGLATYIAATELMCAAQAVDLGSAQPTSARAPPPCTRSSGSTSRSAARATRRRAISPRSNGRSPPAATEPGSRLSLCGARPGAAPRRLAQGPPNACSPASSGSLSSTRCESSTPIRCWPTAANQMPPMAITLKMKISPPHM